MKRKALVWVWAIAAALLSADMLSTQAHEAGVPWSVDPSVAPLGWHQPGSTPRGEDASAGTCEVTTAADSVPGSLRACLLSAQPGDVITFDVAEFPPASPVTISPVSDLPALVSGNVTIDATDAGVILDGSQIVGGNGLTIQSDDNTIRGLVISNFSMHGIYIDGADNQIGGGDLGGGNRLSNNNTCIGVYGSGSTGNWVVGNLIGGCQIGAILASPTPHDDPNRVLDNWIGGNLLHWQDGNGIGIVASAGHIRITLTSIAGNDTGIRVESGATIETTENCLVGNTVGLSHAGSAIDLKAENNWWGATDGPSGIGSGSGDSIEEVGTGTVDYVPWLARVAGGCSSFYDGFESGDISAWSDAVGWYAGYLEVNDTAVTGTNYGLEVTVGGSCSAPDDLVLTSPAQIEGTFVGCESITASGVEVAGGGATFAAGTLIALGGDFAVASGAPFVAVRDPGLLNGLGYVEVDSGVASVAYYAEFNLRLDDLSLALGDLVEVFSAYSHNGDLQFKAALKRNPTLMENRLVLAVRQDDGSIIETPPGQEVMLPDGWNHLEFHWETGAGSGYFTVAIGGSPSVGLSGIDNDQQEMERVRLGYVGGSVTATTGSLNLDEFFSQWKIKGSSNRGPR